jgi:DNA-binding XRE family transcriptional regulator
LQSIENTIFAVENKSGAARISSMKLTWHKGDVITKVREMRDLNRAQLAKATGLSAYSMGQIEKTGNCRTGNLEKIAKALDVPVGLIYEEVPQPAQAGMSGLCPDQKHRTLQTMLDQILDSGTKWAELISGNVISLHSSCFNKTPDLSLVVNGEAEQPGGSNVPSPSVKVLRPKK